MTKDTNEIVPNYQLKDTFFSRTCFLFISSMQRKKKNTLQQAWKSKNAFDVAELCAIVTIYFETMGHQLIETVVVMVAAVRYQISLLIFYRSVLNVRTVVLAAIYSYSTSPCVIHILFNGFVLVRISLSFH